MLCTKMTFAAVIAVIEACMLHSDEELNIQINHALKYAMTDAICINRMAGAQFVD